MSVCSSFFYDILIYNSYLEDHIVQLKIILQVLHEHIFFAKLMQFFHKSSELLGPHNFWKRGIPRPIKS